MIMEFFLPDKIISGSNALESLPDYIKGFGKKALIVTGKTDSTLFYSADRNTCESTD